MKKVSLNLLLVLLSALCFAFSFPNQLALNGFFPLAFIALLPLFLVVHRSHWALSWLYGALFGLLAYLIMNSWLAAFHPFALLIVPLIFACYFLLFFPVLKLLDQFFPRTGFVLQTLAWVFFEYLTTLGFLGYSYGNIGYTQHLFLPLIKIANLTGVWGVSLLVVFPSALLAWCLRKGWRRFPARLRKQKMAGLVYIGLLLGVLGYGFLSAPLPRADRTWRAALIQQNADPWRGGYLAYDHSLDILMRLSREALQQKPDIVIWSETSFVPAIDYHRQYREVREAFAVVQRLLDFLKQQRVPFVVGNDHGEKRKLGTPQEERVDFNAALLMEKDKIKTIYKKTHLVPFTEYFPYDKQFPGFYRKLEEADTHFWEQGEEYTVFESGGVRFSTPICFEDTFGYLCARFVRNGAQVLVNLTNDSWSNSVVAEVQHMILGVFRAVENHCYLLRSTNGGITCLVDPNGKVLSRLPPFTEDFLIADVPLVKQQLTLYTRWGNWFPFFVALSLAGIFLGSIAFRIKKRIDKRE